MGEIQLQSRPGTIPAEIQHGFNKFQATMSSLSLYLHNIFLGTKLGVTSERH